MNTYQQGRAISYLRESLTDVLVTLRDVYCYAHIDPKLLTRVVGAMELAETALSLTDDL